MSLPSYDRRRPRPRFDLVLSGMTINELLTLEDAMRGEAEPFACTVAKVNKAVKRIWKDYVAHDRIDFNEKLRARKHARREREIARKVERERGAVKNFPG